MITKMMHKSINTIINAANGRNVLMFLVPSLAVYFLMLFYTIPCVQSYAPEMKVFDLLPGGYSYDYAIKLLYSLGDKGRYEYLYKQLPLDFIYPALYSISSCLLLAWLFSKRNNKDSRIFYLCFVPIFAGIFDYLENIQIVVMIFNYPDISKIQVAFSSAATLAKGTLTTIFLFLLAFAFIRLWIRPKSESR